MRCSARKICAGRLPWKTSLATNDVSFAMARYLEEHVLQPLEAEGRPAKILIHCMEGRERSQCVLWHLKVDYHGASTIEADKTLRDCGGLRVRYDLRPVDVQSLPQERAATRVERQGRSEAGVERPGITGGETRVEQVGIAGGEARVEQSGITGGEAPAERVGIAGGETGRPDLGSSTQPASQTSPTTGRQEIIARLERALSMQADEARLQRGPHDPTGPRDATGTVAGEARGLEASAPEAKAADVRARENNG